MCGAPSISKSGSKVTRLAERLSEGGGMISEAALARTQLALQEFATALAGIPIEVVATAAARRAKNSEQLAKIVEATLKSPMRIISGNEEAELSRKGASIAARAEMSAEKEFLFVDMGGASTEISFSSLQAPKHSFPCGAVTFMEKLGLGEMPNSDKTWDQAKHSLQPFFPVAEFAPLKAYAQTLKNPPMVAVGGTLVIAAKIASGLKNFPSPYGILVTREKLALLNEKVRLMDQSERLKLEGMETGREDILCGGLLAIDYLMKNFAAENLFITGWGLRHGLLFGQ